MTSSGIPSGPRSSAASRDGLWFLLVNGCLLAAQLLMALTAVGFMQTQVIGEATVDVILLTAQVLLIVPAAIWYDHGARDATKRGGTR